MNRAFLEAVGSPWFLTMFLAFYDTQNRSFRFANAGHWPPILAGSDGSTASLDPTAPILGVLDQFASTDEEITLLPGERVVAYSDGITESRNVDGEEFGFAQLEALVAGGAERSPEDLLGHILTSAQAYRAGHLDHDDTTIWVLEAR
jgi:sigma-B regulation protein RsbU (phosphoserine phosphatase)